MIDSRLGKALENLVPKIDEDDGDVGIDELKKV